MANIIDSSKLTKSAKPATAAEWFAMNKQEAQPSEGTGMDAAALAEAVKLIMSLLQQRQPEPQQPEEDKTNFAQRMGVDMGKVGKPKTTKTAPVRKEDIWGAIEQGGASMQQGDPKLSQAAAVTKYLETDAGAALYRLYKNIQ